jgi:hypothetical protein
MPHYNVDMPHFLHPREYFNKTLHQFFYICDWLTSLLKNIDEFPALKKPKT